jgi:hypothetical protein
VGLDAKDEDTEVIFTRLNYTELSDLNFSEFQCQESLVIYYTIAVGGYITWLLAVHRVTVLGFRILT